MAVTRANPIPDGARTRTAGIRESFWRHVWQSANALPSSFGNYRQPDQYVNEQIGSTTSPTAFVLLRDAVNGVKGRLEVFNSPMEKGKFNKHVRNALDKKVMNDTAVAAFLAPLREVRLFFTDSPRAPFCHSHFSRLLRFLPFFNPCLNSPFSTRDLKNFLVVSLSSIANMALDCSHV